MAKNLKEYGISTLKGAFGAVPFVGTFLNKITFEARSRIKQKRINAFIEEFGDFITEHTKGTIDTENLDGVIIGDVLEEVLIAVSKTSADHKREIFKRLLLNQFESKEIEGEETIRFINITNELTLLQFNILRVYNTLSDNVIKYKIQVLKLEAELKQLQIQKTELKKHLSENSKTVQKVLDDEKKASRLLKSKKSALQNGKLNPNSHKTFGVSREAYIVEIQDLIAKGLLFLISLYNRNWSTLTCYLGSPNWVADI